MTDELNFIQSLRAIAAHPAARGLEDDAAVLQVGSETLILTHDTMVEGVHYLPQQNMADVAWKLVSVNLSDLAAKGAQPLGVLYSHMLGANDNQFLDGLREALQAYKVPLLGGDTTAGGPPRAFGLTAIGRATHRPVPSRSGAKPGDGVYLTGPVGAAMLGFETLRDNNDGDTAAYRRPIALLRQGRALAPLVSAIMDVSDGLLLDASRIANASKVTINLDPRAVPIAVPENRRDEALRWGDDYQLLFTAPDAIQWPVPVHQIGKVEECGPSPLLINGAVPQKGDRLGFRHSRSIGTD